MVTHRNDSQPSLPSNAPVQSVTVLSVPRWREFPRLVHGFLGRSGGFSSPPFDSLNLSYAVGDDPASVKKNWHAWKASLKLGDLRVITPQQVHGSAVIRVSQASREGPGEADALWTSVSGLLTGILTADCVPILIMQPELMLACATHAGWRGTSREIAIKAVEALTKGGGCGPSTLHAALGPSIQACCYPVGAEVFDSFPDRWRTAGWSEAGGRPRLDLRQVNVVQLMEAGIDKDNIALIGPCTSCQVSDFFSSRRSADATGRQLSFVGWT